MRTINSEGKSYLLFPDQPVILHRWQTVGLMLAPEAGNPDSINIFRVYISGNSKSKVEKFLDYQFQRGRANEKSIQVQVEKLDLSQTDALPPITEPQIPLLDEILKQFESAEEQQPEFLYGVGQINVGIDRVYMSTKPPYRIKYTIDPVFETLLQNEKFTFEFSADRPFISLQSHQGNVRLQLFENRPFGGKTDFGSINVSAGNSTVFPPVQKQFIGMWQAFVTGVNLDNSFTLDYSRDIF